MGAPVPRYRIAALNSSMTAKNSQCLVSTNFSSQFVMGTVSALTRIRQVVKLDPQAGAIHRGCTLLTLMKLPTRVARSYIASRPSSLAKMKSFGETLNFAI